jgi:hypothetical protein
MFGVRSGTESLELRKHRERKRKKKKSRVTNDLLWPCFLLKTWVTARQPRMISECEGLSRYSKCRYKNKGTRHRE